MRIFLGIAAQFHEPRCERFAACENERHGAQQFTQPVVVARLLVAQHDIHAMEGDQRRFRPVSHERQQVNARVTEIDMQQVRMAAAQDAVELVVFSAIKDRLQALDIFLVEARQKIDSRAWKHLDVRKGKDVGVFAGLGHHESLKFPQPGNLPVDVPHLALEEGSCSNWRRRAEA